MKALPMELWMQVFRYMWPDDCLKLMTTCRLFHSLLEARLYEDVRIFRDVNEEQELFPKVPQSTLFIQTLTERLELFNLVRKLRLYPKDTEELYEGDAMPENNYWNHPVLWQLPCFPRLRHLILQGISIDSDCYTAIRSIPRLEHLEVQYCDIDAAVLDLQPFQGNTISKLTIDNPKSKGEGWSSLMTPGIHTFIVESTFENVDMVDVIRGLLSCDLRRTLTKLEWTLDNEFDKELYQFIEPCVQLESLSLTYRAYPHDDVEKRSSHFKELSSGSLPMLSKFGGSAEHTAAIMACRSVHSVSLQLWDDTPKDVLLALQLSKVPITKLELWQEASDCWEEELAETGQYLKHLPETIEILSLHESLDTVEKLQSWIPALSSLSRLRTMECTIDTKIFTQIEVVRLLSETCPSVRQVSLRTLEYGGKYRHWAHRKWMWQNGGNWEYYPET